MSTYILKVCYALALLFMLLLHIAGCSGDVMCSEKERQALLTFKQGFLGDNSDRLFATWRDDHNRDCCKWKGVECSNGTGQVQKLHLRGSGTYTLRGEFNITSLLQLQIMEYLDFSNNYFTANNIPEQMGSLSNLRYLNLSYNDYRGMIPYQLGNLLRLEYLSLEESSLEGAIPSQLRNLSRLEYLNLEGNFLVGAIPSQIRNLSRLEYLNLKGNFLVGALPFHVGDLPLLQTLKLNFIYYGLKINDGKWLSTLTSLTNLDLSLCELSDNDIYSLFDTNSNFSTSLTILDLSSNMLTSSTLHLLSNFSINLHELYLSETNIMSFPLHLNFPSLVILDLSMNNLTSSIFQGIANFGSKLEQLYLHNCSLLDNNFRVPSSSIMNSSSSLGILDLSNNLLTSVIFHWIFNFTTNLHSLILDVNLLDGPIPNGFGTEMSSIEILSLSANKLQGEIPASLGNLCTLRELDLSINNLSGELSSFIESSSKCNKHVLQYLDLANNHLIGELPKGIGLMYELETLYMQGNSLEGDITELHLNNLSKLTTLDLSDNSFSLKFGTTWVPPFQLHALGLASCKLGPSFPRWLQSQRGLLFIDISDAGITDIVPVWFWNKLHYTRTINMSYNNLIGTIPNLPLKFKDGITSVVLNSNQFEGSVPTFLLQASIVDLSKNKISDLHSFLCGKITTTNLYTLDLSYNQIKGPLSDCWGHLKSLQFLDLSNNKLSGKIPPSLTTLFNLNTLVLRNNSFIGELPSTLKNCSNLVILDMSNNLLSGLIPSWIGDSLRQLKILSLRFNHFFGTLPSHICYLRQIHVLDVSGNNLSGSIPTCVNNFTEMMDKSINFDGIVRERLLTTKTVSMYIYESNVLLTWKGQEYLFKNPEVRLKSIDLSSNHLSGKIPIELEQLFGLVSLNLSRNNLSGEIPYDIGNLNSLEFLDLSRNHLSGKIHSSLSQIDRLSVLDLSHNSLSGKIPLGTQLQSFDPWRFEANLDLCGKPLEKICPGDETPIKPQGPAANEEDEKSMFSGAFYMSMGVGVFTGFWGLIGSILLWKPWRNAYLKFLDKLIVKMIRCLT